MTTRPAMGQIDNDRETEMKRLIVPPTSTDGMVTFVPDRLRDDNKETGERDRTRQTTRERERDSLFDSRLSRRQSINRIESSLTHFHQKAASRKRNIRQLERLLLGQLTEFQSRQCRAGAINVQPHPRSPIPTLVSSPWAAFLLSL